MTNKQSSPVCKQDAFGYNKTQSRCGELLVKTNNILPVESSICWEDVTCAYCLKGKKDE